MQTLTIASTKGGVGKTTICSGLAVEAAAEGLKIALIDNDPQKSLSEWYALRTDTENIALVDDVTDFNEAIPLIAEQGADWVMIDTAPAILEAIEPAIAIADFVLIPTKTSAFDMTAVDPAVELCHQHRKDFAFVLNMAVTPKNKTVHGAREFLSKDGTVLETIIENRAAYQEASWVGKSAPEIETKGKSRQEMQALWATVKKLSSRHRGGA